MERPFAGCLFDAQYDVQCKYLPTVRGQQQSGTESQA